MIHDYITYELREIQLLIEKMNQLEQIQLNRRGRARNQLQREIEELEEEIKQRRSLLLNKAQPIPSAIYEFLTAIEEKPANNTRTEWQNKNRNIDCFKLIDKDKTSEFIKGYFENFLQSPKIDLEILPAYSFVFQFTFILAQPYISRDEQDFYIIYNPVRKDKVFGLPYVASTSWKGSLLGALWQLRHGAKSDAIKDEAVYRLFGNKKREEDEEKFRAGRLHFFPTFFTRKSLEIINPHDRELRTGKDPILFESVPIGTPGSFTLLYVPFDSLNKDREETSKQVFEDLGIVAKGLQAMFRTYGFGAKTSSGFGLAEENFEENGLLEMMPFTPEYFTSFSQLETTAENLAKRLQSGSLEGEVL